MSIAGDRSEGWRQEVNYGQTTAPSKRIIEVLPNYKATKANAGPEITAKIRQPALCAAGAKFHDWSTIQEGLAA